MKEHRIWFRADDDILEYIQEIKETFKCEFQSQAIRIILEEARQKKIGLA